MLTRSRLPERLAICVAAVLAGATLVACGADAESRTSTAPDGESSLSVLASTAVIADLASRVAGDDIEVGTLIPAGVDVHAYEPPTTAARDVAAADLILVNGYNLEETLLDVIESNHRERVLVVVVSAGITPLAGGHDEDHEDQTDEEHADDGVRLERAEGDPHMWLDPANAATYATNIAEALAALDPANAEGYRARGAEVAESLTALREEIAEELAGIPEERRRLVVFHDAFQYFAAAFDLQLVATVLPSGANQEPSAADVASIVDLVRAQQVAAVYREPQFSSRLVDLVAEETGAQVLELYSDAFGGDAQTYESMMRANAAAIVAGLAP